MVASGLGRVVQFSAGAPPRLCGVGNPNTLALSRALGDNCELDGGCWRRRRRGPTWVYLLLGLRAVDCRPAWHCSTSLLLPCRVSLVLQGRCPWA